MPSDNRSVPPVLLRGVEIEDPLAVALGFLQAYWRPDDAGAVQSASFAEADLRRANQWGARISAVEIGAILERRRTIEVALGAMAGDASLAGPARSVPWPALSQLFDAFADIRGVGLSKMTKALHRKRPALIPMLDSVVQTYLKDDDLGALAPFGERAVGFVRGYKRDLDQNRSALRALRRELSRRGYGVTEVRALDVLIWAATAS